LLPIVLFPPIFSVIWGWLLPLPDKIDSYPWNDSATPIVIQSQIQLSATLYQTASLLLAAVWGIVLAKSEANIALAHWPERVLLFVASIVLVESIFGHVVSVHHFTSAALEMPLQNKTVPDLWHRDIAYGLWLQGISLCTAGIVVVWMVFSAKWLRYEK
jgi:hypothetical protein